MNELIPAFESSIFDTSLTDAGIDFLELGIDAVLQEGLLKDIPIVGTIVGFGKFAQNVHDRNLLRQTLVFINELNNNSISSEKMSKHQLKLAQNPHFREEELGRILILLNKNIDVIKSSYDAKFYSAYINGQITWPVFCELCDITDRLFLSDINYLKDAYLNNGITEDMSISYNHDRLISVGLLTNEARLSGGINVIDSDSAEQQNIMELTDIGKISCSMIFCSST